MFHLYVELYSVLMWQFCVGVCVQYFYNAQTQQYLYWDSTSKTYVPVEGTGSDAQEPSAEGAVPVEAAVDPAAGSSAAVLVAEEVKVTPEGTAERREDEEPAPRTEKKEKEDKPRSLAAFKVCL